jgi:hypothetical protein
LVGGGASGFQKSSCASAGWERIESERIEKNDMVETLFCSKKCIRQNKKKIYKLTTCSSIRQARSSGTLLVAERGCISLLTVIVEIFGE